MNSWLYRLVPKPLELLIYSILALAGLLIGSYRNWIDEVVDPVARATIFKDISVRARDFIALIFDGGDWAAPVASFLFWLVVSSFVYIVAWILLVAVKDFLNEIEVSLFFVHPRSYTESKHWSSLVIHYILKVALLLALIGYGALLVFVLWPAVLVQFAHGLALLNLSAVFIHILPSLLLAMVSIHLGVLLVRLLFWKRSVDYWLQWKSKY